MQGFHRHLFVIVVLMALAPPLGAQSSGPAQPPARLGETITPAAAGIPPGVQGPEAFGPYMQWTSVFAPHFAPSRIGTQVPWDTDYPYVCLNPNDTGSTHQYWAQLDLPNGAEVIWVYARVKDAASDSRWMLWITGWESGWGEVYPDWDDYASDATDEAGAPGYTTLTLSLVSSPVLVREFTDLNGDGNANLSAFGLALRATPTPATATDMCFFGAAVGWRRTVSPAPASASFADVPTDHWAYQFIEALVASGITAGCGGSDYCPDSPVTRAEMAVFLSSALGLHWPE